MVTQEEDHLQLTRRNSNCGETLFTVKSPPPPKKGTTADAERGTPVTQKVGGSNYVLNILSAAAAKKKEKETTAVLTQKE